MYLNMAKRMGRFPDMCWLPLTSRSPENPKITFFPTLRPYFEATDEYECEENIFSSYSDYGQYACMLGFQLRLRVNEISIGSLRES